MKKMLLILFFFPVLFFGQDKSFEFGLLFGGSINSFNGDTEFTKNTLHPIGGVLMQYNFNDRFSLKSRLLYHIKGGGAERYEPLVLGKYEHRLDVHYATLPLLAQWNFGKNKWRFFCNTGPYIGCLTSMENIFKDEYISQVNTARLEMDLDNYNKLDFGLILGSGLSFQMRERIKIFLEFSFDYGLVNHDLISVFFVNNSVVLTQAITGAVGLTYRLPIKKKTFNGTTTLKCADYNDNESVELDDKKRSKWRLVLYKDGKKVGKKSKRGKSRLFKNKD